MEAGGCCGGVARRRCYQRHIFVRLEDESICTAIRRFLRRVLVGAGGRDGAVPVDFLVREAERVQPLDPELEGAGLDVREANFVPGRFEEGGRTEGGGEEGGK